MKRARRKTAPPKRKTAPRKKTGYATFLRLAHELPGVEEGISYGTPAVRVGGRFLARLREDGDLAIRCGFEDRSMLMDAHPAAFYVTDHYVNYPAVLVRLSKVRLDVLRAVIEKAWRRVAPKRLVAGHDQSRST